MIPEHAFPRRTVVSVMRASGLFGRPEAFDLWVQTRSSWPHVNAFSRAMAGPPAPRDAVPPPILVSLSSSPSGTHREAEAPRGADLAVLSASVDAKFLDRALRSATRRARLRPLKRLVPRHLRTPSWPVKCMGCAFVLLGLILTAASAVSVAQALVDTPAAMSRAEIDAAFSRARTTEEGRAELSTPWRERAWRHRLAHPSHAPFREAFATSLLVIATGLMVLRGADVADGRRRPLLVIRLVDDDGASLSFLAI